MFQWKMPRVAGLIIYYVLFLSYKSLLIEMLKHLSLMKSKIYMCICRISKKKKMKLQIPAPNNTNIRRTVSEI
jgi:hypothetical protein